MTKQNKTKKQDKIKKKKEIYVLLVIEVIE